jgi:hypothetical protein
MYLSPILTEALSQRLEGPPQLEDPAPPEDPVHAEDPKQLEDPVQSEDPKHPEDPPPSLRRSEQGQNSGKFDARSFETSD